MTALLACVSGLPEGLPLYLLQLQQYVASSYDLCFYKNVMAEKKKCQFWRVLKGNNLYCKFQILELTPCCILDST